MLIDVNLRVERHCRVILGSTNPGAVVGQRGRTSRPGVSRREKNPPKLPSRSPPITSYPRSLSLPSSSLLSLATLLIPSPSTQLAMRTQVISTLLRARPATVSRLTIPRLARSSSNAHHQETFESFTERYVTFFQSAEDLFEVQRGLNNCFAHDLVPAPAVVESALRASRRVNDYATAVRILEGIKEKVENKTQYQAYMDELKPIREELGEFCFVYNSPTHRVISVQV